MKTAVALFAVFSTLVALSGAAVQERPLTPRVEAAPPIVPAAETNRTGKIAPEVREAMASLREGEMIRVIVTLTEQAGLGRITERDRAIRLRRVIEAQRLTAGTTQSAVKALLETRRSQRRVGDVTSFWIFNGLAVTATADVILELAAHPDVLSITPNTTIQAPSLPSAQSLLALFSVSEVNLQVTNVSALWDLGMRGQGIVVASMDTGVDVNHPDLSAQWRGGTNSWFDPNSQHPTIPTDTKGHGTWTMGIMVGQDASGIAVGVAPDARWIAVKIFDDRGMATVENIHKGFQWLLDPDETPGTPDAPHVVNNSWGYQAPGCNLEFQQDLRALRAAGILPVFAAGNAGPAASTSVSPANYPEAFAVGATNNSDLLYTYGSRGPSGCGQAAMIFPEVVAPGVSIYTTDLHGNYISVTGTSLAAAHVAGALALLLSADPGMTVAQQEAALIHTAVDLGSAGADNDYGHGRLDVLAAYQFRPPCPAFAAPPDVSVEDIQAVAAHWRRQSTDPGWDANFDLNQDGTMTTKDIMLAVARLGEACW